MDQTQPVTGEQDGGQGGPHAVQIGVQFDLVGDRCVALVHGVFQLGQQIAPGLIVVEVGQRGDHQLGGDLPGGVPTHAVGQRQQPGTGVDGVLIVGADQTAVAAGGVTQGHRHGRSSITVLPTCTGVPIGTRTAVVTFERSR